MLNLRDKIRGYHGDVGEHDRSRSWEHCYRYFHKKTPEAIAEDRDHAALQLGFYLASWGMYRGSGFLLQYDYTINLGVVNRLFTPEFSELWGRGQEFGGGDNDEALVPTIVEVCKAVREAYSCFGQASDILVTKVILGTLGCLPAFDTYFEKGFKHERYKYSQLDAKVIEQLLRFCGDNLNDLREEQARIESKFQLRYPLMKLVDMCFHQIGFELDTKRGAGSFVGH